MIAGADIGNSRTKFSCLNGKEISFPSLTENGFQPYNMIDRDSRYQVIYNGNIYTVGAGTPNTSKMKYSSDYYKIHLLTAAALACTEPVGSHVRLAVTVSLPVDVYTSEDKRKLVTNELLSIKNQEITVRDNKYTFTVVSVGIWIEGGVSLRFSKEFKDNKIIVVDIGGMTIDYLQFNHSIIGVSSTEKRGILVLEDSLLKIFKQNTGIGLDELGQKEFINAVLQRRSFKVKDKNISLAEYCKYIETYITQIFTDLESKYLSLDDKLLYFIGGGSLMLHSYLQSYQKEYHITILKDAEFSNARNNLFYSNAKLKD